MFKENNERLKLLIKYIEENLTEAIDYKELAKILLVNEYSLHRIFYFVTGISLVEYIRKRRLSRAAIELLENKQKIVDMAVKYQYDSATAFSRAFRKMMGFTPKDVYKYQRKIVYFPIMQFDDVNEEVTEITFQKLENVSFELYIIGRETTIKETPKVARDFWKEVNSNNIIDSEENAYGVVEYKKGDDSPNAKSIYSIGCKKPFKNSKKLVISNKKFLMFQIDTIEGKEVNKFTNYIYTNIIPNLGYNLDEVPDIEEYIDEKVTKIYIPII